MGLSKLTLDTNSFINYFDSNAATATSIEELREIMKLAAAGRVDVAVTTRVEADLSQDKDEVRRREMLKLLREMPVVGTVLRWDTSKWDSGDMWSSAEDTDMATEIQRLLFPGLSPTDKRYSNMVNDIDHLLGHFKNRREIFVTDDRGILKKADPLREGFGILVMRPAEALGHILETERRSQTIALSALSDDSFASRPFRGRVTFDYSNNDGRFVIGDGKHLFETRWSKASDTSIHAYGGSRTIRSLALAKGVDSLELSIKASEAYDYSSRVRTPQVGQIVVWQNVNGFYAATKILALKDDTRGASHDEIVFEYLVELPQ